MRKISYFLMGVMGTGAGLGRSASRRADCADRRSVMFHSFCRTVVSIPESNASAASFCWSSVVDMVGVGLWGG